MKRELLLNAGAALTVAVCHWAIAGVTTARAQAAMAAQPPIEQLLATAEVGRGQISAKICAACHTLKKGGGPLVGPNLWGVVGRRKGSQPGFAYSTALQAKGGSWTIDDLDHFITSPSGFVPGTKMPFAGVPNASERADIIAYLNSLSDNPALLPKAAETAAETASAPKSQ
jgi:cytochrome c